MESKWAKTTKWMDREVEMEVKIKVKKRMGEEKENGD